MPVLLFMLLRYFYAFGCCEVADVAEVDVNLLRSGLAMLDRAFVNNYLADEGSQNIRRQFCNADILLRF